MSGRRITRNIELEELLRSRSFPDLAVDLSKVTLAASLVIALVRLAFVLQGLRDLLDAGAIFVRSGYRTLELHEAIYAPKPAPKSSRHLRGTAADFQLEDLNSIAAFVRVARVGLEDRAALPPFDRLCLYPKRGHLHVDIPQDAAAPPARDLYVDNGSGWQRISYEDAANLLEAA